MRRYNSRMLHFFQQFLLYKCHMLIVILLQSIFAHLFERELFVAPASKQHKTVRSLPQDSLHLEVFQLHVVPSAASQ